MAPSAPPKLTDKAALRRSRLRARHAPEYFLHEQALSDVHERLSEVNRTFTAPAIITGAPDFWQKAFPDATIVADEDRLDLAPGAHDLVIDALTLHWSNDPVGQMVQARHGLRPDGLYIGLCFGGQTLQELRRALAEAESRSSGGLSPRVAPMGEIRDLGGLLQRAGFALPVADSLPHRVSYTSALHLMRDLRAMGETNAMNDRLRRFTPRSMMMLAQDLYQTNFPDGDSRVVATFEIITLTGWAPAPDQPKALRPGSAQTRLADALGTQEFPATSGPKD